MQLSKSRDIREEDNLKTISDSRQSSRNNLRFIFKILILWNRYKRKKKYELHILYLNRNLKIAILNRAFIFICYQYQILFTWMILEKYKNLNDSWSQSWNPKLLHVPRTLLFQGARPWIIRITRSRWTESRIGCIGIGANPMCWRLTIGGVAMISDEQGWANVEILTKGTCV